MRYRSTLTTLMMDNFESSWHVVTKTFKPNADNTLPSARSYSSRHKYPEFNLTSKRVFINLYCYVKSLGRASMSSLTG